MNKIGKNILQKRKELGWTQEELAKRMGYKSKSTINKIELGINDITQSKIAKFAEVLGTTPSFIMGWDEKIEENPVEVAQRHVDILADKDIDEMFDDFKKLSRANKQLVKDLVKNLTKTEV